MFCNCFIFWSVLFFCFHECCLFLWSLHNRFWDSNPVTISINNQRSQFKNMAKWLVEIRTMLWYHQIVLSIWKNRWRFSSWWFTRMEKFISVNVCKAEKMNGRVRILCFDSTTLLAMAVVWLIVLALHNVLKYVLLLSY